jgi:uncharacterized protein (TIGR00251 family)
MKINITVKPNSTRGPLVEKQNNGSFIVFIREIASDGQANKSLVKILSDYFDTPKTSITIIRGQTSRKKIIEINQ